MGTGSLGSDSVSRLHTGVLRPVQSESGGLGVRRGTWNRSEPLSRFGDISASPASFAPCENSARVASAHSGAKTHGMLLK